MKVKFYKNELKIISLLEDVKSFISIKDLTEKVRISERSIYKNLSSINRKLKQLGIEGVRNVYGHGYYFSDQTKLQIREYFSDKKILKAKLDANQRIYLDYLLLFINGKFSVAEIIEQQGVTRQTVLKDIENLKYQIKDLGLNIISTNDGHILQGHESQIRHFLFLMLYANRSFSDLYSSKEITELKSLIDKWISSFESTNNLIYSDEFIYSFETFYALTLERIFNGFSGKKKIRYKDNLATTAEYKAAGSFLPILLGDRYDKFETYYLATILLGGQKRKVSENSISQDIDQIAQNVIRNFKNLADCEFKDENQLLKDLVVHLSTTFFRVKYQQQYSNSSFKLIKENYPDIYIYTQMSIHPFERLIGASLNDYEVGLISTYFASQIANKMAVNHPDVLLINSGSNGSSRFLLTQLVEQYPYVNFSMPISRSMFEKKKEIREKVILSTVNINSDEKPILKVNPILTINDLNNIDKFFQLHGIVNATNFQTEFKSIMDIISDNTKILNNSALEDGIKQILSDKKKHKKITERRKQPLLSEVLTKNMIKFSNDNSLSWQQAIQLSAQPLIKTGKISNEYVDAIIKNVNDNGPYINIGTEIALAHARPDQGVKKLGMSLLLLDHDIDLVDNKHKIRLIIVLAAIDSTSHLKALSELAQILGNKDDVNKIMQAKNADDIEDLILKGEKDETRSML